MKIIYTLLFSCALISCQKETKKTEPKEEATPVVNTALSKTEKDSIELEEYWKWTKDKQYQGIEKQEKDTLALKHLEINRNEELLNNFIKASDTLLSSFTTQYTPETLKKQLYTIDFNADKLEDVIYYGPWVSEGSVVHFFLNTQSGFKNVFTQRQILQKPKMENGKLKEFIIFNPGCCAEYEVAEYKYNVEYIGTEPKFVLEKTTGYSNDFQKPQQMLAKELPFKVTANEAILRPECYILNAEHPIIGESGNKMESYSNGWNGKAIATHTENGTEWLFVLMEPTKAKKGNTDTFHTQPTRLYGWILKSDTNLK